MSEKVTGLTSRQRKAIEAILENKTITQASKHAGVSRKTIYVWLGQPSFREELDRLGGIILDEVSHRMVSLASEAVEKLAEILHSEDVPIRERIQVVNIILTRAVDLWDIYNLNKRIEVLEEFVNEEM